MQSPTFILIYIMVAASVHHSVALRRIKRDETDVLTKNDSQIAEDFVKVVNLPNTDESPKPAPKLKVMGMFARKLALPRIRNEDANDENEHEKVDNSVVVSRHENQETRPEPMAATLMGRGTHGNTTENKLYRIGDLDEFKFTNAPPVVKARPIIPTQQESIKKNNQAALDYFGHMGLFGERAQRRVAERMLESNSNRNDENNPKVVIINSRLELPEMASFAIGEKNGYNYPHVNQRKVPTSCQSQKVSATGAKITSNHNNNNGENNNNIQNSQSNYIENGNNNNRAVQEHPSSVSATNAPAAPKDNQGNQQQQQQQQQKQEQQQQHTQQQPHQLQKQQLPQQQQQQLTQQQQIHHQQEQIKYQQQQQKQHQQLQQQLQQQQQQLQQEIQRQLLRQQEREQQQKQVQQLPFGRPNSNLSPMENVLKFANMLLYKVGLDGVPMHAQGTQISVKPNSNPMIRINSGSEGDDFDAIDYFYNNMEPSRMDGITGTAPATATFAGSNRPATLTSFGHPYFMQSQFVPANEPPQPFNFIESALDMLLAGDGVGSADEEREVEMRCPMHQEKKDETTQGSCGAGDKPGTEISTGGNGGGGAEESGGDDKDMMVCSCRIYKKKMNTPKGGEQQQQSRCG